MKKIITNIKNFINRYKTLEKRYDALAESLTALSDRIEEINNGRDAVLMEIGELRESLRNVDDCVSGIDCDDLESRVSDLEYYVDSTRSSDLDERISSLESEDDDDEELQDIVSRLEKLESAMENRIDIEKLGGVLKGIKNVISTAYDAQ